MSYMIVEAGGYRCKVYFPTPGGVGGTEAPKQEIRQDPKPRAYRKVDASLQMKVMVGR